MLLRISSFGRLLSFNPADWPCRTANPTSGRLLRTFQAKQTKIPEKKRRDDERKESALLGSETLFSLDQTRSCSRLCFDSFKAETIKIQFLIKILSIKLFGIILSLLYCRYLLTTYILRYSECRHMFTTWNFHQKVSPKGPRKRTTLPCASCEKCHVSFSETPEVRRGPSGPNTLCNSCGLKYAREKLKEQSLPMLSVCPSTSCCDASLPPWLATSRWDDAEAFHCDACQRDMCGMCFVLYHWHREYM